MGHKPRLRCIFGHGDFTQTRECERCALEECLGSSSSWVPPSSWQPVRPEPRTLSLPPGMGKRAIQRNGTGFSWRCYAVNVPSLGRPGSTRDRQEEPPPGRIRSTCMLTPAGPSSACLRPQPLGPAPYQRSEFALMEKPPRSPETTMTQLWPAAKLRARYPLTLRSGGTEWTM